MTIPFNDLSRAAAEQHESLNAIAAEVLASGWFVHGPQHKAFEQELADYLGVNRVLGTASGTDALEIAFRAVATPTRRTIITAANAGGYSTCAALAAGLTVRLCDIDPDTHTLSPESLRGLVDDSVAAVVVTHLYGRMGDVDGARQVCAPLGIAVIEDCAQSLGARDGDRMGGSIGDLATFSFYPTKNLGALGDGGAIATTHAALDDRVAALRQYGWSTKYTMSIQGGRNSRLDELQAAFLRHRLPLLDAGNHRRRAIISRYAASAPDSIHVLPASDQRHTGHLAVVVTESAPLLAAHLREHGVSTEIHYPIPDYAQPFWESAPPSLPTTESFRGRILSLPCFPELTVSEVDAVCSALASFEGAPS